MKIIHRFFFGAMILFGIGCAASLSSPIADPRADRERMSATDDPGCTASTLVSTGGAFPKDSRTLAIRWTGYTNYELAYNGQIILLDTHFDRGSMFPPLGFTAADISERTSSCSATVISTICRMPRLSAPEPVRLWLARRSRLTS